VANNGLASVRKLIEAEFGKIRQHQEPAKLLIVAAEESFETKANALYGQAVQALQADFPAAVPKIKLPKYLVSKSAASAAVSQHKHHGRDFVQAPRETLATGRRVLKSTSAISHFETQPFQGIS
jgi:hypothetical protein